MIAGPRLKQPYHLILERFFLTPRHLRILERLKTLGPTLLDVVNDSARHHGHAGDDGSGETHFIITISARCLAGKGRIDQQRMIHGSLADEFETGLHALTIHVKNE
jgi:BolA family transcriptional regulator, general stress-responsive regulator